MGNLLWKRYGDTEPAAVYKYDELNRLTDIWYSFTGTLEVPLTYPTAVDPDVHYEYDGGSRLRTSMVDSSGTSSYIYDTQDRLQTYTPPAPTGHAPITYTYNALGQKKSITNGSVAVNYDYYANGWLKRVRNGASLVSKYTLDVAGNRTSIAFGNGTSTVYAYDTDPRYRVSSIVHNVVGTPSSYTISYRDRDGAGNPLYMQDWNPEAGYTYDEYSRLEQTGGYDQVGNRNPGSWSYNAVDQLISTTSNRYDYLMTGSLATQYNSAGTLTEKMYGYTLANLLSAVTHYDSLGNPVSYSSMAWDGDSNRISFTSSTGGTTQFVYDTTAGIPAVIEEVLPSTQSVYYIREPNGELIARMAGTTGVNIRYYHFDALGSTKLLTDSTGAVTDRYTYDAWGALTNHERLTGSVDQPYQYVGQLGYYTHYQDTNLPMLQLGVRFYDPALGRFTQVDPVRHGIGSYEYAMDDPVMNVDPLGLFAVDQQGLRKPIPFRPYPKPRKPYRPPGVLKPLQCYDRVMKEAEQLHNENDKVAHCYAVCEVIRRCALFAGPLPIAYGLIDNWDDDPYDNAANIGGVSCAYSLSECETCCRRKTKCLPNDRGPK